MKGNTQRFSRRTAFDEDSSLKQRFEQTKEKDIKSFAKDAILDFLSPAQGKTRSPLLRLTQDSSRQPVPYKVHITTYLINGNWETELKMKRLVTQQPEEDIIEENTEFGVVPVIEGANTISHREEPLFSHISNQSYTKLFNEDEVINIEETTKDRGLSINQKNSETIVLRKPKVSHDHQMMQNIISTKTYSRLTKKYNLAFAGTLTLLLSFLIWLNFYVSGVSESVNSLSEVMINAYFRAYWMKLANQETRYWTAVKAGIMDPDEWLDFQIYTMNKSYHRVSFYDGRLQQSLSKISDDIQAKFYEKDVRIYRRGDNSSLEYVETLDSFQSTIMLVSIGMINIYKAPPELPTKDFIDEYSRFIFDNSFDDLLVRSNYLIRIVKEHLFQKLTIAKKVILVMLITFLLFLVLFIITSFAFIRHINNDFRFLMEILYDIPLKDTESIEQSIIRFKALIDADCQSYKLIKAFNLETRLYFAVNKRNKGSSHYTRDNQKIIRRAYMKKFESSNNRIFAQLLLTIILIISLMLIYYNDALQKIQLIEKQHINIYSAMDYINTIGLTSVEISTLCIDSEDVQVLNSRAIDSFEQNIEIIADLKTLQDNLKNSQGGYSEFTKDILFNFECADFATDQYSLPDYFQPQSCDELSRGQHKLGLINVLSELSAYLKDFKYNLDHTDDRTTLLSDFYSNYITNYIDYFDMGSVLLLMSFSYSTNDFHNLVKKLENERVFIAWITLVASSLWGALTWLAVIKRLSRKEFKRNDILSLIPKRILLKNKKLNQYIIKTLNESKTAS